MSSLKISFILHIISNSFFFVERSASCVLSLVKLLLLGIPHAEKRELTQIYKVTVYSFHCMEPLVLFHMVLESNKAQSDFEFDEYKKKPLS